MMARPRTHGAPEGTFRTVRLSLVTSGGDCRHVVERSLRKFFAEAGIAEDFKWGDEYWASRTILKKAEGEEGSEAEKAAAAAAAELASDDDEADPSGADADRREQERAAKLRAAGGLPSWMNSKSRVSSASAASAGDAAAAKRAAQVQPQAGQSIEKMLLLLNPTLTQLAQVPWMRDSSKRAYARDKVLPKLEAQGWPLRAACTRLWEGERDMAALSAGVDPNTAVLVNRLLMHTKAFEAANGAPKAAAAAASPKA
jgi:hypothetical protein